MYVLETSKKILIVCQGDNLRDRLKKTLSRWDYEVVFAVDGEDALQKWFQFGPFRALITEFRLPRLSGGDLATRIKMDYAQFPVIFLSGSQADLPLVQLMLFENVGILHKPISDEALNQSLTFITQAARKYGGPEKRKFRRIDTHMPALVTEFGLSVVTNLSGGGAQITLKKDVPLGTNLSITLPELQAISLTSTVMWKSPDSSESQTIVGVQFQNLQNAELALIARFVFSQLRGSLVNPSL